MNRTLARFIATGTIVIATTATLSLATASSSYADTTSTTTASTDTLHFTFGHCANKAELRALDFGPGTITYVTGVGVTNQTAPQSNNFVAAASCYVSK